MANSNKSGKDQTKKAAPSTATTAQQRARAAQQAKKNRVGAKEYWKGVKLEMSKVVWPTRQELGSYTVVVVLTCAAFALGFWAIDTGVLAALRAVLGITLS